MHSCIHNWTESKLLELYRKKISEVIRRRLLGICISSVMGVRDNFMNERTYRIRKIKSQVDSIWINPKSHTLENHYKFMRKVLLTNYPQSLEGISNEALEDILHNAVYLDRFLRRKRQGKENKLKTSLAKAFKKEL